MNGYEKYRAATASQRMFTIPNGTVQEIAQFSEKRIAIVITANLAAGQFLTVTSDGIPSATNFVFIFDPTHLTFQLTLVEHGALATMRLSALASGATITVGVFESFIFD